MARTMFEKIWEAHEVREDLIYIDLHLVHEVTSPQAFEGLRMTGRKLRRPDKTVATADHNVPTDGTATRTERGRSAWPLLMPQCQPPPGASDAAASGAPNMTASAPQATALAMSPPVLRPPSAMRWT